VVILGVLGKPIPFLCYAWPYALPTRKFQKMTRLLPKTQDVEKKLWLQLIVALLNSKIQQAVLNRRLS
jgi:hypothetical protein